MTCAVTLALGLAPGGPAAAVDYGDYHTFAEVEAQLAAWSRQHGDLAGLQSIGKSTGGKDLWVATVAGPGAVPPAARPAIFVGANIAGFHNAGTEAALDLIETLLAEAGGEAGDLLASHTFYVAPALNPDAHDGLFAPVRERRGGAAGKLDRDRDGFSAEDGCEDLDGDGRITRLRIPDPEGGWLPHPEDPRVMIRADAMKGRAGAFRIEKEGFDNDGDGASNEDPAWGVAPDRNFPHAFPYPEADAGPWPGFAPETKAVMDFLLAHRNVALAVVYGPANNFLEAPRSLGGSGDLGTQKFKLPEDAARFIGLDPEQEYTLDEVWEVARELPFVKQNNITKEQVAQFLGAGPATQVDDDDQALLSHLAKAYKKRLDEAGLGSDRPAEQYGRGGLTPWLYYQYGTLATELDVWAIPKAKAEKKEGEAEDGPLTLDAVGEMSPEDFVALPEEKVAEFLKAIKAPPQFTAEALIARVRGGQVTPAQIVQMAKQMGAGGGDGEGSDDDPATERRREVLAWIDAHAPEAVSPWTAVTLPDGTRAEAGGIDPAIEIAPPHDLLVPALKAHTATVLDLASKTARVEILSLVAEDLGGGVFRVKAVAGNRGFLPTHTKMAQRARSYLPVRLELGTGAGLELVTGQVARAAERLEGTTGTLAGEWLIRAQKGTKVTVRLSSQNAGNDVKTLTLGQGGAR